MDDGKENENGEEERKNALAEKKKSEIIKAE